MDTAPATASHDRDTDERRRPAAVHRYQALNVDDGALNRITALLALSVPDRPTTVPVQENR